MLHVASPFPPVQPKDPDELIVPARDGALRVLRAALDAGVERVAHDLLDRRGPVRSRRLGGRAATPRTTGPTATTPSRTPYVRSKTIAEQAAWEHVRAAGAEDRLATINPGAIIGPALNDDHSYSLQAVQRLLDGMPAAPRLGFTFVDVRDVADLHIRAMTEPAGGGERFIATDRFLWIAEVAAILRERLGDAAPQGPDARRAEPARSARWRCSTAACARSSATSASSPGSPARRRARRSAGRRGPSRTRSRTARAAWSEQRHPCGPTRPRS